MQRIESALRGVPGVDAVSVNLLTRMATIRHDASVKDTDLLTAVGVAGYQASLASPANEPFEPHSGGALLELIASQRARFVAGAILTLVLLVVDRFMAGDSKNKILVLFLLATPIQITIGWDFYRGCFRALRRWSFTMDSLVVMGSTAAYVQGVMAFIGRVTDDPDLGHWEPLFLAAAGILTIVALGKWLESHARESTSRLWGNLMEMMPKQARVLRDGREQIIPAGVVAFGDIVVVRPNERIPVDGEVVEGTSDVNEALITGETRPVPKVKGDQVLVASLNGDGFLRVRSTGVGDQSTLARISRMVSDAQMQKSPFQQTADKVSGVLVPIVFLVSLATFATWYFGPKALHFLPPETIATLTEGWLSFLTQEPSVPAALLPAIAVLVVACPFALGLATPTVVLIATGRGARRGLLFKGGQAIEAAGRVSDVIIKKSGILTDGSYRAEKVLTAQGVKREELLNLAASLEAQSEHPLAKGVLQEARKTALCMQKVEAFEDLPGRGLQGRIGKRTYLLGSRSLMDERRLEIRGELGDKVKEAESAGLTTIFLGQLGGRVLGAIALADKVKDTAAQAISDLQSMGMDVHLLTGDNPAASLKVAEQCGLEEHAVHAHLSPEDKIDFTWKLREKRRRVAVVGDGINDEPAMAAAEVGLSLGTGTDISVTAGSVVLVSSDPRGIARVLHLAREAHRIIRWNLMWAFSFNLVMIPLAACNRLPIGIAVVTMALSSILVVVNSFRLTDARIDAPGRLPLPEPHPAASAAAMLASSTPVNLRSITDHGE